MISCKVRIPLRRDGITYGIGDLVDIPESEFKRLLAQGVVEGFDSDEYPPVIEASALAELFAQNKLTEKPTPDSVFTAVNNEDMSVTEVVIDEAWELYQSSLTPEPPVDDDITIIRQIVALFKQWQGDGEKIEKKPNVDSVRDALDNQDITVDQRDAAWDAYCHANDDKGSD